MSEHAFAEERLGMVLQAERMWLYSRAVADLAVRHKCEGGFAVYGTADGPTFSALHLPRTPDENGGRDPSIELDITSLTMTATNELRTDVGLLVHSHTLGPEPGGNHRSQRVPSRLDVMGFVRYLYLANPGTIMGVVTRPVRRPQEVGLLLMRAGSDFDHNTARTVPLQENSPKRQEQIAFIHGLGLRTAEFVLRGPGMVEGLQEMGRLYT